MLPFHVVGVKAFACWVKLIIFNHGGKVLSNKRMSGGMRVCLVAWNSHLPHLAHATLHGAVSCSILLLLLLAHDPQGLQSISTLLRASASPLWKGSKLEHLEITSDGQDKPAQPSNFLGPATTSSSRSSTGKPGRGSKRGTQPPKASTSSSRSSQVAKSSLDPGSSVQAAGVDTGEGAITTAGAGVDGNVKLQAQPAVAAPRLPTTPGGCCQDSSK
jgi:hypothetical protein